MTTFLLTQLAYRMPTFLAAIAGLIFSIVWMRRCPTASRMVMIGCCAIALVTVGNFALTMHYVGQRPSTYSYGQFFVVVGIVSNLIHSGGVLTIILAAFVGRKRDEPLRAFPVQGVFAPPTSPEHHG